MNIARMVYGLLERQERRRLALLAVFTVFTGLMETGGVASILPFVRLVAEPAILTGPGIAGDIYRALGFTSTTTALIVACVVMLAIIAMTNTVGALGLWAMGRWGWALNDRLSTSLLRRYLLQPYAFFLGRNTGDLNQRLLEEVGTVVTGIVFPAIEAGARAVAAGLIVVLLAIVDVQLAAVVTLMFGGGYGLVYAVTNRAQNRLGETRFAANSKRFRIAGEALMGIKDVKALSREHEFLRRFAVPSKAYADSAARALIVSRIPRNLLETVGFGTVLVIILRALSTGGDLASVLPVVSLYAFAGYRLLPAIYVIFSNVLTIRFNAPALEVLHRDLTLGVVDDGDAAPVPLRPLDSASGPDPVRDGERSTGFERIELRKLSFRYDDADREALTDVDLEIRAKEIVGLVGRTGVGKTTLVDLLLGLLIPTGGAIVVDGEPMTERGARLWRRRCGYVPQDVFLADDTVESNIAFGIPAGEIDRGAVERAARVAQLHDFVTSLPAAYETVVGERGTRLSGGQRQRIGIARALYGDPDILFLDEATSALDGATESVVMDTIRSIARKKTIIVIAHRLSTVRSCDVIHVLEDGGIAASGSYDELLRGHEGFRAMAGEAAAAVAPE